MDLDRYLATHKADWERLERLSANGRRGAKQFSRAEVSEFTALYEKTAANLSYVRTYFPDPPLVAHLSKLVSTSGNLLYGTKPRTLRAFLGFFSTSFPAAVWGARRFVAISAALLLIPALVTGVWIANSPKAQDAAIPPAYRETYLNHDFEEYYDSERAPTTAAKFGTNNIAVAIRAFGGGIVFCIPTALLLILTGATIGFAAGLFTADDQSGKFWGLILPHGLLEITAVIIAGAAGLMLGWTLISPGDRGRSRALAAEARTIIAIVLGLIPTFAVAALIEGFVTGQPWPAYLRVGIGVVVEVAFVLYLYVMGSAAHKQGLTGAIGEKDDAGWAYSPDVEWPGSRNSPLGQSRPVALARK